MTFAERLQATRKLAKLPAYELAELGGLSAGYVAHLERGRTKSPGLDALEALARVLGVTIDYLVSGTGPEPTEEHVVAAVARARSGEDAA